MYVHMAGQVLRPGVQHQGDADLASQPAGIFPKRLQGFGSGLKQQVVNHSRVALHQRIQFMR